MFQRFDFFAHFYVLMFFLNYNCCNQASNYKQAILSQWFYPELPSTAQIIV